MKDLNLKIDQIPQKINDQKQISPNKMQEEVKHPIPQPPNNGVLPISFNNPPMQGFGPNPNPQIGNF